MSASMEELRLSATNPTFLTEFFPGIEKEEAPKIAANMIGTLLLARDVRDNWDIYSLYEFDIRANESLLETFSGIKLYERKAYGKREFDLDSAVVAIDYSHGPKLTGTVVVEGKPQYIAQTRRSGDPGDGMLIVAPWPKRTLDYLDISPDIPEFLNGESGMHHRYEELFRAAVNEEIALHGKKATIADLFSSLYGEYSNTR